MPITHVPSADTHGRRRPRRAARLVGAVLVLIAAAVGAQERTGGVAGDVLDGLGARVPGAAVSLLREGRAAGQATTDAEGHYAFDAVESGRYQVRAEATGFEPQTARPFFVGPGARVAIDLALQIGLRQEVVVTASAEALPASQVGAPVTVVDHETLEELAKPDVLEALRLVPGVQVAQGGERGASTSLFVRGGASNFNKVLVDG